MDKEDLVTLCTVSNPGEAEVLKNALEEEGIACTLDGELQGGLTGVLGINVVVHADDLERAQAVLNEHEPLEEDDDVEFGDSADDEQ